MVWLDQLSLTSRYYDDNNFILPWFISRNPYLDLPEDVLTTNGWIGCKAEDSIINKAAFYAGIHTE